MRLPSADPRLPEPRSPEDDRSGFPVLSSKLAPPELAHATVQRPRLITLLSRAVQRSPVTLLSGPAGSGKTTLAASWRQGQRGMRPIAWLTLDDYEDEPATFWGYVVQSLSAVGVPLPGLPRLIPGEAPPNWFVPQLAARIAALPRPVVLVVDNADHLTDRSITAGLDLLIRHAGSRLRLVLCGRADPLLPLHQYRLSGTLSQIRGDQLSFIPEETRDLLTTMGVPVSAAVARALTAETRGWAVGLRLAAAPLKQGMAPERLVTSLAHDDGSVAQYLFAEVLADQPAGVRRFLLRVSVDGELSPELVDRLTGASTGRRILAGLAHNNAFVEEFSDGPGGFRIHPWFREMLQGQLAYEHPEDVAGLHRECMTWYAEQGRGAEAVGHAIAAGEWSFVTRHFVDDLLVTRLLAHGSDPALRGLQALPADLTGPEAAVIRTAVAVAAGATPAAADLAVTVTTAQDEDARATLRVSAVLTHLTTRHGPDDDAAALLAEADVAAALVTGLEEDRPGRRESVAVLSTLRALAALSTDAPLERLAAGLRAAAVAAQGATSRRLRCRVVAHLALLEALAGSLTRAAQLADEAEALAGEEGREEAAREPAAAAALAWVHLHRYALVEARESLQRARERERSSDPGVVFTRPLLAVLQSRLLRLRHEYDAADQCLRPHLEGPRLPGWVAEHVVDELVRLAISRGHVDEGLALLRDTGVDEPWTRRLRVTVGLLAGEPVPVSATQAGLAHSPAADVESAVISACCLLEAGRAGDAAERLAHALDLGRPELLRWPFVDTPPQARRLLRTHPRLAEPSRWLSPSATTRPPAARDAAPAPSAGAGVIQDLSDRELEVLRHLADMLSTAEIAAAMFISVNTVRTHIRSILRKLAVTRRNQAVRRARERGIL